jgi:hypothetical protein
MRRKNRMGMSILAGGLAFVGTANATDLIVNGSFEDPSAGWIGTFGTYNFSAAYFSGPAIPASGPAKIPAPTIPGGTPMRPAVSTNPAPKLSI